MRLITASFAPTGKANGSLPDRAHERQIDARRVIDPSAM